MTPPVDPVYGRPDVGWGRPDNSLPGGGEHPWLPGHPGKPPGRPILPPHVDNGLPPLEGAPPHPWLPGHWEPVDPGFGKPPLWGWILGPDNGLPVPPGLHPGGGPSTPPGLHPGGGPSTPPGLPPQIGGGPSTPPGLHPGGGPSTPPGLHPGGGPIAPPPTHKPTPPGQGGVWVPTDPDYGKPVRPCPPAGGKPRPPIWAWIPDRPTIPGEGGEGGGGGGGTTTVTLYPTTVAAPAPGGSGSVNVTLAGPGTWEVDAASVPAWVTLTPMGPQTTDQNIVFTVAANSTGMTRQAVIKVSGATLTINQAAV